MSKSYSGLINLRNLIQDKCSSFTLNSTDISKSRKLVDDILHNGDYLIYGANLLPGHMDHQQISAGMLQQYEDNLLSSHCIDSKDKFSPELSYIALICKLLDINDGSLGVSHDFAINLVNIAKSGNLDTKIPKGLSYSSGDVIPASHLAKSIKEEMRLKFDYELRPGELMALINGDYIHKAYAAMLLPKLELLIHTMSCNAFLFAFICDKTPINNSRFSERNQFSDRTISAINTALGSTQKYNAIQKPVSIRAIGDVISLVCEQFCEFANTLNFSLLKSSGNPIFDLEVEFPISQASFINFQLTQSSQSLSLSLGTMLRAVQGRNSYLLSGEIEQVPQNAATSDNPIRFIQHPKAIAGIYERLRHTTNIGLPGLGATSYGIEDLWSNGLHYLDQLEIIIEGCMDIFELDNEVIISVLETQHLNASALAELNHTSSNTVSFNEKSRNLSNHFGLKLPNLPWVG